MNKNIVIALTAVLLVIAAAAIAWSMRSRPVATGPALATLDYTTPQSWAVKPGLPPPAVWETGWEIDVVLLASGDAIETSGSVSIEKRRDDATRKLDRLADAFGPIGPVYAPYLRAANVDSDMATALGHYLSTDNRGRAFLIATDTPLPAGVVALLQGDPLVHDRFGGVLAFGDGGETPVPAESPEQTFCSRRYSVEGGCTVTVELRRASGKLSLSGHEPLTGGFVAWLDGNVSKLAEPLGELEEIEIIEIQRPPEPE